MTPHIFDTLIIGGGMAGAALAAELARTQRVAILERETQPGYHSTGRSAAIFSEIYGGPAVRALSHASRSFLAEPPAGFSPVPLLRKCGVLFIARDDQAEILDAFRRPVDIRDHTVLIDAAEARALAPLLRPDYVVGAVHEPAAADIDVHALHHGFLATARRNGAAVMTNADISSIERTGGTWSVIMAGTELRTEVIVNAAGAWADQVATLAGAPPVGIEPRRRTIVVIDAPQEVRDSHWPMVVDIAEEFYLKPDSGRILISPADETPVEPCDVQPEELDIATAIDRAEAATTLQVRRVVNKWAGLRNFVPDRNPVLGFDAAAPGFFWLAGQGGYGIQTAPAMARLAASLVRDRGVPSDISDAGLAIEDISVQRLACRSRQE